MSKYDHLTKDELVRLLETRESRDFLSRVFAGFIARLNRITA
jgi:hypothetical protein